MLYSLIHAKNQLSLKGIPTTQTRERLGEREREREKVYLPYSLCYKTFFCHIIECNKLVCYTQDHIFHPRLLFVHEAGAYTEILLLAGFRL
jgi:hypothetical protein